MKVEVIKCNICYAPIEKPLLNKTNSFTINPHDGLLYSSDISNKQEIECTVHLCSNCIDGILQANEKI